MVGFKMEPREVLFHEYVRYETVLLPAVRVRRRALLDVVLSTRLLCLGQFTC